MSTYVQPANQPTLEAHIPSSWGGAHRQVFCMAPSRPQWLVCSCGSRCHSGRRGRCKAEGGQCGPTWSKPDELGVHHTATPAAYVTSTHGQQVASLPTGSNWILTSCQLDSYLKPNLQLHRHHLYTFKSLLIIMMTKLSAYLAVDDGLNMGMKE